MGFSGGCVVVRPRLEVAELRRGIGPLVPEGALVLVAPLTVARRQLSLVAVAADDGHPGNDHLAQAIARACSAASLALVESEFFQCAAYELCVRNPVPEVVGDELRWRDERGRRVEPREARWAGGLSVIGAVGRGEARISYDQVVRLGLEALIEAAVPDGHGLADLLDRAERDGTVSRRTADGWARSRGRPDLSWPAFGMSIWPVGHIGAAQRYRALKGD